MVVSGILEVAVKGIAEATDEVPTLRACNCVLAASSLRDSLNMGARPNAQHSRHVQRVMETPGASFLLLVAHHGHFFGYKTSAINELQPALPGQNVR